MHNHSRDIGQVIAIHLAQRGGQALESQEHVRALPGRGLEGDRYFHGAGTFQKPGEPMSPSSEVSLIEIEALEGLQRECGITLTPAESRRNILTRGIALNDLVGREFTVGSVRMRGIKQCRPCEYLESKTQPGVKAGLTNRGGLRAQILTEGVIRAGDVVKPVAEDAQTPGAAVGGMACA